MLPLFMDNRNSKLKELCFKKKNQGIIKLFAILFSHFQIKKVRYWYSLKIKKNLISFTILSMLKDLLIQQIQLPNNA